MSQIMRVEGLSKNFGGLQALNNVTIGLQEEEILGLIGPNGAGKSTLINCISGVLEPNSGRVFLGKADITDLSPYKICAHGIGRTFQVPKPFSHMTILENLTVVSRVDEDTLSEYLDWLDLASKQETLARNLTFQEQRKLELARALVVDPKVALLDEIVAGLNPSEVDQMVDLIKRIRSEMSISILWIEHVMEAIMEAADRIVVIHEGSLLEKGTPTEIANDKKVVQAYLGKEYTFEGGRDAAG